jgi:hypothetical protein
MPCLWGFPALKPSIFNDFLAIAVNGFCLGSCRSTTELRPRNQRLNSIRSLYFVAILLPGVTRMSEAAGTLPRKRLTDKCPHLDHPLPSLPLPRRRERWPLFSS